MQSAHQIETLKARQGPGSRTLLGKSNWVAAAAASNGNVVTDPRSLV